MLNCIGVIVSVENVGTLRYSGDDLLFMPYLLSLDLFQTVVGRFLDGIATFTQTSGI